MPDFRCTYKTLHSHEISDIHTKLQTYISDVHKKFICSYISDVRSCIQNFRCIFQMYIHTKFIMKFICSYIHSYKIHMCMHTKLQMYISDVLTKFICIHFRCSYIRNSYVRRCSIVATYEISDVHSYKVSTNY